MTKAAVGSSATVTGILNRQVRAQDAGVARQNVGTAGYVSALDATTLLRELARA